MELTNLQKEKVDELLNLYDPNQIVKIDFKSPTGSGKTLMATAFISEMIAQHNNEKFIFVIATPSSSDLPFSLEQKILQYKQDLAFSNFSVEYIKSPSETGQNMLKTDGTIKIIPEENKVYIFGKSSFGENRILTTRHIIDDFVDIVRDKGFKLIYIRDEAHIGGRITDDENFEFLMQNNANLIIKMTATPDYSDLTIKKVVLTEEELNNPSKNNGKYLLKTTPEMRLKGSMTDEDILEDAIKRFKEIKVEYDSLRKDDVYIRPAMLIQVDNNSKTDKEKMIKFEESLKLIEERLKKANLSYAKYFGNNDKDSNTVYGKNFDLNEISKNNSDFDVIIFKIGPATGWDIPRACMLLQLRNVCSEGLNIQTIGRIKRNCYKNLQQNKITDVYYIYSNAPKESNNNITIFNANVKEEFVNEEFMSIEISNVKEYSKKVNEKNLKSDLDEFLQNNRDKILVLSKELFSIEKNQLTYKDIHFSNSVGIYYTPINNVFQFIKYFKRLKESNSIIFDKLEKIFKDFWKNNYQNTKICGNYNFTFEMFCITLIQKFSSNIMNFINKNNENKIKYEVVSKPYNPQFYPEIHFNEPHTVDTISSSYMFNITSSNSKFDDQQPIGENDTSPEVYVFRKIKKIASHADSIKLWGKNFTTSNVNGAYLDDYNNLHHSFFDFIVKFNNNAFLYIEVKGEKDINPEKTKTLEGAYGEYFNKKNLTLFDKPIVIAIFKVSKKGDITPKCFYSKEQFNKNLNELSVDELFEEISSVQNFKI